ncbi:MAG: pyridoxamine 5'-phosphate oxidase family protein [Anaerolineales bacterium]|nr:pyridoxamine 5'-phosphate oxidase family protein [Anaerolineales bacterium]
MLDYARQRAREILKSPRSAILATGGPAGVQAGEFACEAAGLDLYLLVPWTSDHLFNIEHAPRVTLLTAEWELKGTAQIIHDPASIGPMDLLKNPGADLCTPVRVRPSRIQIRRVGGWGNLETIDLETG